MSPSMSRTAPAGKDVKQFESRIRFCRLPRTPWKASGEISQIWNAERSFTKEVPTKNESCLEELQTSLQERLTSINDVRFLNIGSVRFPIRLHLKLTTLSALMPARASLGIWNSDRCVHVAYSSCSSYSVGAKLMTYSAHIISNSLIYSFNCTRRCITTLTKSSNKLNNR